MSMVPLIKGDKVDNTVDYRDALPVNYYAVNRQIFQAKGYMNQWYGLTELGKGEGVDRGALWVARTGLVGHYRVSGSKLITVDSLGNTTVLGDVGNDGKNATIVYSFNNVAVVSAKGLYYYNTTDGFRQITADGVVGKPLDIVWVDGYFFLTDGEFIYHSNIADEEDYLPLDFGDAQYMPDPSRGLGKNQQDEVLVFGQFSTENFRNVGKADFAFQRVGQKAQKLGILGTYCKKEMNGKWYTLARRQEVAPSFHIVSLGSEMPISTRETTQILAEYTPEALADVTVDTMVIDNTGFVIFNLPFHTLVFNDAIANTLGLDVAWTILKTDVKGDQTYRAKNPILDVRSGKWVVGDKRDSTLGYLDRSVATHYDEIVESILYTPFVPIDAASIDEIELQTIPGIAPSNDARVFISMTEDGRIWSQEWIELYGDNYEYGERFITRRLGYIRDFVGFKFRTASRSRMSFCQLDVRAS